MWEVEGGGGGSEHLCEVRLSVYEVQSTKDRLNTFDAHSAEE